ncbi:uncharacterized protein BP5553_01725 [Venustampulla echinocandica]|uniref:Uncharacterized protein n=1 Tax=Venustampulla echinocandica TaxID=2656787 RepID=A0A370U1U3_9HELO|nr:uncharacterized protein BP5553_01725 [Venustampulla echinocandica]RDL41746.1 hypothetical protein BP5553_01725 [Venustampulla echinocandica]
MEWIAMRWELFDGAARWAEKRWKATLQYTRTSYCQVDVSNITVPVGRGAPHPAILPGAAAFVSGGDCPDRRYFAATTTPAMIHPPSPSSSTPDATSTRPRPRRQSPVASLQRAQNGHPSRAQSPLPTAHEEENLNSTYAP